MRGAARISDVTAHLGSLASGEPSVLINGKPAVRMGDMQVCPQHGPSVVVTGAPLVLVKGAPLARVLDLTMCAGGGKAGSGGGSGGIGADASVEGPQARSTGPGKGEAFLQKTKRSLSLWIFSSETTTYLQHHKGEVSADGDLQGSAEAAGYEESTKYKIAGATVWETETKHLSAEAHDKEFVGEQGTKTGFHKKAGMEASWTSTKHINKPLWADVANLALNPFGYNVEAKESVGASAGVGATAELGAYHDKADGRYHFVSNGMLSLVEGVGVGIEISVGKTGGANASGQGAIPNPIATGSPDVFLK